MGIGLQRGTIKKQTTCALLILIAQKGVKIKMSEMLFRSPYHIDYFLYYGFRSVGSVTKIV